MTIITHLSVPLTNVIRFSFELLIVNPLAALAVAAILNGLANSQLRKGCLKLAPGFLFRLLEALFPDLRSFKFVNVNNGQISTRSRFGLIFIINFIVVLFVKASELIIEFSFDSAVVLSRSPAHFNVTGTSSDLNAGLPRSSSLLESQIVSFMAIECTTFSGSSIDQAALITDNEALSCDENAELNDFVLSESLDWVCFGDSGILGGKCNRLPAGADFDSLTHFPEAVRGTEVGGGYWILDNLQRVIVPRPSDDEQISEDFVEFGWLAMDLHPRVSPEPSGASYDDKDFFSVEDMPAIKVRAFPREYIEAEFILEPMEEREFTLIQFELEDGLLTMSMVNPHVNMGTTGFTNATLDGRSAIEFFIRPSHTWLWEPGLKFNDVPDYFHVLRYLMLRGPLSDDPDSFQAASLDRRTERKLIYAGLRYFQRNELRISGEGFMASRRAGSRTFGKTVTVVEEYGLILLGSVVVVLLVLWIAAKLVFESVSSFDGSFRDMFARLVDSELSRTQCLNPSANGLVLGVTKSEEGEVHLGAVDVGSDVNPEELKFARGVTVVRHRRTTS